MTHVSYPKWYTEELADILEIVSKNLGLDKRDGDRLIEISKLTKKAFEHLGLPSPNSPDFTQCVINLQMKLDSIKQD